MYIFALWLGWLPVAGYISPFEDLGLSLRQIIMPVMCLALFPMAVTARQTRSALLGVLRQDYIRTAWSKGLSQRTVILRHALKNSLIPIVTLSGMSLAMIVGGEVFVETVFNIPGIGRLAVDAVSNQDYPYIQGIALLVAVVVLAREPAGRYLVRLARSPYPLPARVTTMPHAPNSEWSEAAAPPFPPLPPPLPNKEGGPPSEAPSPPPSIDGPEDARGLSAHARCSRTGGRPSGGSPAEDNQLAPVLPGVLRAQGGAGRAWSCWSF